MHHLVSARTVIAANNNAHFPNRHPRSQITASICVPRFGAHALNLAGAGVFAQAPIHHPSRKKSDEVWYEDAKWHSRAVGLPLRNREAGRGNRNSMMRRSRGKLGLLSLPLDAAVTSATSGNFSSQRVAKGGAMHTRRELCFLQAMSCLPNVQEYYIRNG